MRISALRVALGLAALVGGAAHAGESPYTGPGAPTGPVPYYCYSVLHVQDPGGEKLYYYHSDILQVDVKHDGDLKKAWHDHVASIRPGSLLAPNLCSQVSPDFKPVTKFGESLEKSWKDKGAQIMPPDWKYEPGVAQPPPASTTSASPAAQGNATSAPATAQAASSPAPPTQAAPAAAPAAHPQPPQPSAPPAQAQSAVAASASPSSSLAKYYFCQFGDRTAAGQTVRYMTGVFASDRNPGMLIRDWQNYVQEIYHPTSAAQGTCSNAGATPQAQQQALAFMEQAMAQARIQIVHVDWKD